MFIQNWVVFGIFLTVASGILPKRIKEVNIIPKDEIIYKSSP